VPWLAGCSSSETTVDKPGSSPEAGTSTLGPSATPSPQPTAATSNPSERLAAPEQALAALAAAILVGPHHKQLSKDRRQLLTFLRNAHTAHAHAISNPLPTPALAKIGGQSLNSSLVLLSRRESATAGQYRTAALKAKGSQALLWGSLAVASGTFAASAASGNPPAVRPIAARQSVEVLSEVAAVQEMVRQLHAIIYGYQLAIGKLKVLGTQRPKAERELLAERIFRDRLIAWLQKHSADIPAAEPAYVPSVVPNNAATAGRLIMRMQTALQPFCGLWLAAAASQSGRQQALTALIAAVKTARSWGAPLAAWPGFSS
jgi:hypothetical protein